MTELYILLAIFVYLLIESFAFDLFLNKGFSRFNAFLGSILPLAGLLMAIIIKPKKPLGNKVCSFRKFCIRFIYFLIIELAVTIDVSSYYSRIIAFIPNETFARSLQYIMIGFTLIAFLTVFIELIAAKKQNTIYSIQISMIHAFEITIFVGLLYLDFLSEFIGKMTGETAFIQSYFIVISVILIQNLAYHIASEKQFKKTALLLLTAIPVAGFLAAVSLPSENKTYQFKNELNLGKMFKKTIVIIILFSILLLSLSPFIHYFPHSLLTDYLAGIIPQGLTNVYVQIFMIWIYLVIESFAYSLFSNKGFSRLVSLLGALLPITGLLIAFTAKPKKQYRDRVFTLGKLLTKFVKFYLVEIILLIDFSPLFKGILSFIPNETFARNLQYSMLSLSLVVILTIIFETLAAVIEKKFKFYSVQTSIYHGLGVFVLLGLFLLDFLSVFTGKTSFIQYYFIIISVILIQDFAYHIAREKQLKDSTVYLLTVIPVLGLIAALFLPTESKIFRLKKELNLGNIFTKTFGLIILCTVLLISFAPYVVLPHTFMAYYVWLFFLIVLELIITSISYEIYTKKGYPVFRATCYAFVPIFNIVWAFVSAGYKSPHLSLIFKSFSIKEIAMKFLIYAELTLMVVIVVIPLIYITGASFATTATLPTTFLPAHYTFSNYHSLLFSHTSNVYFGRWYLNTFLIAVITMVVGVVFITGAAYIFSRFRFKGKKVGMITILVLQIFPSFMGMIAMYVLFLEFGLLDKPLALSIIYIGGSIPFNLWLIRGYLLNVPKELDEAAMIDGANKLQIFFRIILPLSVPILSFVAVSLFMSPWMDYILPSYLLDIQRPHDILQLHWTIAVGLWSLISNGQSANYTLFAAGALIVALPITILYLVFQKYLVEGITAGSTKG